MRKWNALRRMKTKSCQGRATMAQVNEAKKTYVEAAMKKGQTSAEATAKANKVVNGKCSVPAVSGPKGKAKRK